MTTLPAPFMYPHQLNEDNIMLSRETLNLIKDIKDQTVTDVAATLRANYPTVKMINELTKELRSIYRLRSFAKFTYEQKVEALALELRAIAITPELMTKPLTVPRQSGEPKPKKPTMTELLEAMEARLTEKIESMSNEYQLCGQFCSINPHTLLGKHNNPHLDFPNDDVNYNPFHPHVMGESRDVGDEIEAYLEQFTPEESRAIVGKVRFVKDALIDDISIVTLNDVQFAASQLFEDVPAPVPTSTAEEKEDTQGLINEALLKAYQQWQVDSDKCMKELEERYKEMYQSDKASLEEENQRLKGKLDQVLRERTELRKSLTAFENGETLPPQHTLAKAGLRAMLYQQAGYQLEVTPSQTPDPYEQIIMLAQQSLELKKRATQVEGDVKQLEDAETDSMIMMENSERGRERRRQLIEVEKAYRAEVDDPIIQLGLQQIEAEQDNPESIEEVPITVEVESEEIDEPEVEYTKEDVRKLAKQLSEESGLEYHLCKKEEDLEQRCVICAIKEGELGSVNRLLTYYGEEVIDFTLGVDELPFEKRTGTVMYRLKGAANKQTPQRTWVMIKIRLTYAQGLAELEAYKNDNY